MFFPRTNRVNSHILYFRSFATKGTKDCYYKVLGVNENDSIDKIKTAYRTLAKKHHPDLNTDANKAQAEKEFQKVSQAYEVLSDPEKKSHYDMIGTDDEPQQQSGGGGQRTVRVEDLFSSFFGGGAGGPLYQDIAPPAVADLTLSLEDLLLLPEKTIKYKANVECSTCSGTGSKSKKTSPCISCQGKGFKKVRDHLFVQEIPCSTCKGSGKAKVTDPCGVCSGNGLQEKMLEKTLQILPGLSSGDLLSAPGAGNASENKRDNGKRGDLEITIRVREHPTIKRSGGQKFDLGSIVKLPLIDAVLGTTVDLQMLGEKEPLKMKVPSGTTDGTQLRVAKMGLPKTLDGIKGPRGNFFCELRLEYPKDLTDKQKKLLKEFQEEEEKKSSQKKQSTTTV